MFNRSTNRFFSYTSKSLSTILTELGYSTGGGGGGSDEVTVVLDRTTTIPGSPSVNDTYLVACGATGAWAGQAGNLATWNGSSWDFTTPTQADVIFNATDGLQYTRTSVLGLAYTQPINELWQDTQSFWQAPVIAAQTSPPGSPNDGDRYLVTATATGAWSGQENNIASYRCGTWTFHTPLDGQMIWNSTTEEYITYNDDSGGSWQNTLERLGINITSPSSGDVLVYDGTEFVNEPLTMGHISDVDLTGLSDGQILEYSSSSGNWELITTPSGGGGVADLDDLSDVTIGSLATGQVLRYNGSVFTNTAIGLNDLSDVSTAGVATGYAPVYNGSSFSMQPVLVGAENIRIIRGTVNSAGSIIVGSGFTITKIGTGDYRINFNTALSALPTCVASAYSVLYITWISDPLTTSIRVHTSDRTGSPADAQFAFMAAGLA